MHPIQAWLPNLCAKSHDLSLSAGLDISESRRSAEDPKEALVGGRASACKEPGFLSYHVELSCPKGFPQPKCIKISSLSFQNSFLLF